MNPNPLQRDDNEADEMETKRFEALDSMRTPKKDKQNDQIEIFKEEGLKNVGHRKSNDSDF